jgi:hypothetical protein
MPLPGQQQSDEVTLLSIENFSSINTKPLRPGIKDEEFSYIENFMPLGKNNLRTLWDNGAVLYTAPVGTTIIYKINYTIKSVDYWAVFLSNGEADQVQISNGAIVHISTVAGTFYNGGDLPAAAQFENKYLAIVSDVTANGYWIWDGTDLFTSGSLSPDATVTNGGRGYTSPPTVTISGGTGTGATATAVIKDGVVTEIDITNPGTGYSTGDLPVLTFSGGGSDNGASATATIDTTTGQVTSINVLSGGTGYTTASVISFGGSTGIGAAAVITGLTNGSITAITVTNGGVGYNLPPTVSVSVGSGAELVSEISSNGIIAINLTSGGTGYTSPPTITIVGDGTGATAIANMVNSSVAQVNVTFGGSGYVTAPNVIFTGAATQTAFAYAVITGGAISSVFIVRPGSGYASPPGVTFSSGAATATAVLGAGGNQVQSVIITNQGQGYTHASVLFSGGNNSASGTISIFPFGFQGTTIETYQNRVWIGNKTNVYATAPNTTGQFAASQGGIVYTVTDSTLRQRVVRLAQSSGSLYTFGDSNISAFSNVTVSANGSASFNQNNIDPQIGTPWPNSVAAFGRALVFANSTGVYALFGGAAQKVSDALDGLFQKASFNTGASGVTPTASVATLFQTKCYVLTFTTITPNTNTLRTIQAIWDGQRWFLGSQGMNTQSCATQEFDSQLTSWGDDGKNLYPMFTTPSDTLVKTFSSKLFGMPPKWIQATRVYVLAEVISTTLSSPTISIGVDNEKGPGTLVVNQPTGQELTFYGTNRIIFTGAGGVPVQFYNVLPGVPSLYGYNVGNYGRLMGITCQTVTADLVIMSESLLVRDYASYG